MLGVATIATIGFRLPALNLSPSVPVVPASAAAFALTLPASPAFADTDLWLELNKPPFEFSPFSINPVGYVFLAGWFGFLAYRAFGPEGQQRAASVAKFREDSSKAAAAAPAFLSAAAKAEGAVVQPSVSLVALFLGSSHSPRIHPCCVAPCPSYTGSGLP